MTSETKPTDNSLAYRAFMLGLRFAVANGENKHTENDVLRIADAVRSIASGESAIVDPTAISLAYPDHASDAQALGRFMMDNDREVAQYVIDGFNF